ncbi:MAG: hypothetical protein RRC07_14025 [Anaerolineae bacterium]|nr:hypothetical protein [Anaerolineae bacterium]
METNNQKWLAEEIEKHADGQDAELPAGLARISGSLQQAMQETQPRPGFINELAEQIEIQQRVAPRAGASVLWLWRLLVGAAAVLVVIAFAFFVSGLFSEPLVETTPAGQETVLPPVVLRGESGQFAGVEFRLHESLPTEPEQLTLYQAEVGPLPETAEAVRDLAKELGMDEPAVYRTGQGWLAEDEAGRRLMIDPTSTRFPIIYHVQSDLSEVGPGSSPPSAASRAAAFLEAGGLLPAAYEKRERLEAPGFGRMLVEIIPLLDGRPVHSGASEVVLDPHGGVVTARILPLRFTPTGEQLTAQPGQEAFASVLQDGATMDAVALDPVDLPVQTFYPALAEAAAGDEVRLLGFVRRLEPADGGPVQTRLTQSPDGAASFLLNGAPVDELPDGQLVEVAGVLVERAARGGLTVTVESWQAPPIDNQYMECRSGVLHREGDDLVFLSDDGREPYKLAYPPAVAGGARVEVCTIFRPTPYPLPWLSMTSPPVRERLPALGTMSGAGLPEEVQVVEVTRIVVAAGQDGALAPPAGAVGLVTEEVEAADGTVFTETAILPLEDARSPFEIGQQVEVTGIVGGFLRIEDEQVVPRITLAVDTDDDPTTAPVTYPLTGPWSALMAISRQNHLHVTVPATVVKAEEERQGPEEQALAMDGDWWQSWPDEMVEPFRGHYEVATLEGRDVRLFVDEATGRRYVDATPLFYARPGGSLMSNQPHASDPVWVTAVANPDPNATFGGLPILTILRQQGGPNLPDSPEAWMLDVAMPLHTGASLPGPAANSRSVIIDRAVLGYTYHAWAEGDESQTLQPTWLFYGHSSDERSYFVLRAPAVKEQVELLQLPGDGPWQSPVPVIFEGEWYEPETFNRLLEDQLQGVNLFLVPDEDEVGADILYAFRSAEEAQLFLEETRGIP